MGQTNNVEYQISLKDLLSGKVREAEGHVNHFEHTLEHTRDLTKEMAGAAVGFFGLYQGVEFIKSSVESYNKVEDSIAQIGVALKSTMGIAGITMEDMISGTEEFNKHTVQSKESLYDMGLQLLSFPQITKAAFNDIAQATLDISALSKKDLHETSIMIGKAFADPSHGIMGLRRYGVVFSEEEVEKVKKLQASNHLLQAQQLMLAEINRSGYQGQANELTLTEAGQLTLLKKQFDEVKESVGKLVMEEVIHLAPAIKEGIADFKELTEWVDKNKETIITVGEAIGAVIISMYAWEKANAIISTAIGGWEMLAGAIVKVKEAIEGVTVAEEGVAAVPVVKPAVAGAVSGLADKFGAPVASGAVAGEIAAGTATSEAAVVGGEAGALSITSLAGIVAPVLGAVAVVVAAKALAQQLGIINKSVDEDPDRQHEENLRAAEQDEANRRGYEHIGEQDTTDYSKLDFSNGINPIADAIKSDAGNTKLIADLAKKNETESALHKDKKTADTLSQDQLGVQGQTIKNIKIEIHGDFAPIEIKTTSVKESAPDIKRIVEDAITAALNDAEINN